MYVNVLGRTIPVYGLLIVIGVVFTNLLAVLYLKKKKLDIDNFIILEAYCFLGAFFGAKFLYLLVSFHDIQWRRVIEFAYFNSLMQGGFVFYGGLIGGLLFVLVAGKIHRINSSEYISRLIFFIPCIHCFGRIGCHIVGCCYGIAYDGFGSIVYSSGFLAPSNIPLFPVQLIEAVMLFLITLVAARMSFVDQTEYTVPAYFAMYGITRFMLEFLRGDSERGIYGIMSTSQWISLTLVIGGVLFIIKKHMLMKSNFIRVAREVFTTNSNKGNQ